MIGTSIIRNGRIAPPSEATFTLDDIDTTYGYGCYETLKARDGVVYFAEFHEERLLRSASILGIAHTIVPGAVAAALALLVRENAIPDCNIKVMLIGHEDRAADWYAFLLPPVIPPASAYDTGVSCLLFRGERHFPNAKSLSMLLSTVAYRFASALGCYDALLVNGRGEITEGTRTNVVYAKRGESGVVYTPPATDCLEGVTRRTLVEALAEAGIRTVERSLPVAEAVGGGYAVAVTSTSSRVIPVRALVGMPGDSGPEPVVSARPHAINLASSASHRNLGLGPELERVRTIYDAFLDRYADGHM